MDNIISRFSIYGLWNEKDVHLRFTDNTLILVGENGSGKTTILRIIYETLACKWTKLAAEDFHKIEIEFSKDNSLIQIAKEDIESAKQLIVDKDSSVIRSLPGVIRRAIDELEDLSDQEITYDQLMNIFEEYEFTDASIVDILMDKIRIAQTKCISELAAEITKHLGCYVIYLPTYRRAEKRIGYVNEKDYKSRQFRYTFRKYARSSVLDNSMEIVKTGMDDVDYYIKKSIDEIHKMVDISASRLNYQCFKGILNKTSDAVRYDSGILTEEEIEKVFGSINEDILSPSESEQIQQLLRKMNRVESAEQELTYNKIVYYYYSMLHERYLHIKDSEQTILRFFNACNKYLVNKHFAYDGKEFSYKIFITNECSERSIELEDLSSGEKQVVSIFSYLYLSQMNKAIILIDEPELSLSVPWQRKFLCDINNSQLCCGLISVTHSPFVYDNNLRRYTHSLEEFIY